MGRCAHCQAPAEETWDLRPCAIGESREVALCTPCDIELNEIVLRFIAAPDADALLAAYRAEKLTLIS
jgi:hypothetical protein